MDISIIIPAYNAEKYLARSIRSALSQNYPRERFEVIVINDGSSDHTEQVAQDAGSEIRLISYPENKGLPTARNLGIRAANGRFVFNLDSDDYMHQDTLMVEHLFLSMNSDWSAVSCDYILVDDAESHVQRVSGNTEPIACGVMFRKDVLIEIGLYDEEMLMCEERELRRRFEINHFIGHIQLPLYRYRRHENNMTNNVEAMRQYEHRLGPR